MIKNWNGDVSKARVLPGWESEDADRLLSHRRRGPERDRKGIRAEGDGDVKERHRVRCGKREQRRASRREKDDTRVLVKA